METLRVALLGEPLVVSGDTPVAPRARKALGVFLWLAQKGTPQTRREAARLFWGGADEEAARTSLRTALQRLPVEVGQALDAGRDRIALRAPVELDTARFEKLAAADDVRSLGEAAAIYRGEFWIDGESLDATPEFDDWLQRERSRYRQLAQSVFDRLIARHVERAQNDRARASAERETAFATARRWLELEPASETAHRWVMQLHADAGQRDAAMSQYEVCRREMAVAHGRSPSAETQKLYEALIGEEPRQRSVAERTTDTDLAGTGLPTTAFVGRIEELAEIDRLLADPDCRLLTLQGLGGVGKSRLAHAAAVQQGEQRGRRVAWVALQSVFAAAQQVEAMASAVGADLRTQADPVDALVAALGRGEWCVVLDNFEQLVDADGAVDAVLRVLRGSPRTRFIITSRQVLGVQEEWVYELHGLACPDDGATWTGSVQATAAELFVQRARQSYFGFSPGAEWPHIVRICRAVDGLPLGIELAAAWVRTVPCGDIAGAVEREIDQLGSRHRDRPPRHQGLEAVVGTSWLLLPREQQDALAALGLFGGACLPAAAQVVAETSLRVLSALVDKSLVQRRTDGRLALHPIVGQYARHQLDRRPNASRDAKRRYAAHLAAMLSRERARLDAPEGLDALETLLAEVPNISAALPLWESGTPPGLPETAEALAACWRGIGRYRRVVDDVTRWLARDDLPAALTVELLVQRGRTLAELNDLPASRQDFVAALERARALGQPRLIAFVQGYALTAGFLYDDPETALKTLHEIEPAVKTIDNDPVRFAVPWLYAGYALVKGRFDEAIQRYVALTEDLRNSGSPQLLASTLDMHARALLMKGESRGIEALIAESISIHERSGNTVRLARALNVLAGALLTRPSPDNEAAERHAARAVELFERVGAPVAASAAADTQAAALIALGRVAEARAAYERAIPQGRALPIGEAQIRCHLTLLCVDTGDVEAAATQARALLEMAVASTQTRIRWSAMFAAALVDIARFGAGPFNQAALRYLLGEPSIDELEKRDVRRWVQASSPVEPVTDVEGWLRAARERLA